MSFIKRLMEIKEWQKLNEARQTYLLLEILEELKRGGKRWKK